MKKYGIILAAGKGRRFGFLKQFFFIKNNPLFIYSVIAFENSLCDEIFIVTLKNKKEEVWNWIKKLSFKKVKKVIIGGKERFHSVRKALKFLPNHGYVAIHDASRPLITPTFVNQGFKLVEKYKAVIFGIKSEDTLKTVFNNQVIATLDREHIYRIQTPQFFEINLLKKAYQLAKKEKWQGTDDAFFLEKAGFPVYLFEGDKKNLKVTTKEDLELIKNLI
ncbi:MAG: 2-C-methyl-D-erythritol 4-phosphate cytidylyltransferase [candidate division WOR-3 bacterium]|nr:2-C-methyl-D-erythritol 4-phosphate cytidylyltransferase [candidate division WOR-3 bacterium]MCX7836563.1 2-C-methyl-D-erythritol 4-phosphate cytidylyltransferase [candidate division WOR-3 bacterium]MDW8113908.1 2-C-methyl-D-erythritol 4-phosphate cytidylyltransferase [candidate division WOR-3 bacterium]